MSDLRALASAIVGHSSASPVRLSSGLVDLAEAHGVDALLAASPATASAEASVQARLKDRRAAHAALCAARDEELQRALRALERGGVRPVVIKGAHLAHVLYATPGLRPRADSDLVIDVDERSRVVAVLEALDYRPALHVRGDLILGQWHFRRADAGGIVHALDVHWRIAAPLVFRHVLPAARLRADATPIPALGDSACGPALHDALVIACVHIAAHHRDAPLLLWLYEIAVLARSLDASAARAFVASARDAGVLAVCATSLNRARQYFDDEVVEEVARAVDLAREGTIEPSAAILGASGPLDELWIDLRVCSGWRERAALVREHLYPDREYIRATAAGDSWLPWAYARRALRGARRWTRFGGLSAAPDRTAGPAGLPVDSAAASRRPYSTRTTR